MATKQILFLRFAVLIVCLPVLTTLHAVDRHIQITTEDGQCYFGFLEKRNKLYTLSDGIKRNYFTEAIVKSKDDVQQKEPEVVYLFDYSNEFKKNRKTLGMVQDKVQWHAFRDPTRMSYDSVDFKHGKVTVHMVLTKLTHRTAFFEALNYNFTRAWPTKRYIASHVMSILQKSIRSDDPSTYLKAALFLRQYGDLRGASLVMKQAQQRFSNNNLVSDFIQDLQYEKLNFLEKDIEYYLYYADHSDTDLFQKLLRQIKDYDFEVRKNSELINRVLQIKDDEEALVRRIGSELRSSLFSPPRDAHMLLKLLDNGVPPASLKVLEQWWAKPLRDDILRDRGNFDPSIFNEAQNLAEKVSVFFEGRNHKEIDEIARLLEKSLLPEALKMVIVKYARNFESPFGEKKWRRVDYRHHISGEKFHYYIQIPRRYNPQKPCACILSLHGQTGSAEQMVMLNEHADKYNYIMISPEYIYGRRWGYEGSTQEHYAVLGALYHAALNYNIDRDRVFLQGHSQGGHAAWDIGAAHAEYFAGVMPFIGAHFNKRHVINYLDTTLYIVDGDLDGQAPKLNRASIAELAKVGANARYIEYIDRNHESFMEEFDPMFTWMRRIRRDPSRKHVNIHALRSSEAERSWINIRKKRGAYPGSIHSSASPVSISAKISKNHIRILTKRVTEIDLRVPLSLINVDEKLVVYSNNKKCFAQKITISWEYLLKSCLERNDRQEIFINSYKVRIR